MSFQQTQFLGASVKSFTTTLGLNGQTGSLVVDLAEDLSTGNKLLYFKYNDGFTSFNLYNTPLTINTPDSFAPPNVGSPVYFRFGDFSYGGILQSIDEMKSEEGTIYRVTINDPRGLLEASELILSGYNGSVYPVSNMFNIYGFWEDPNNPIGGGFGQSLSNEGGMPWYKILQAVNYLTNANIFTNIYGGPSIRMMGFNYSVDVSLLPIMPQFYRVGPGNINLLAACQQVCEDSGYDLFVNLVFGDQGQLIIQINTVSRIAQPQLGQIDSFIAATPNVNAENVGQEFRNEYTSAFLVGGQQEYLWLNFSNPSGNKLIESEQGIWPYWGLDPNGNAILGRKEFLNNTHNFDIDTRFVGIKTFPASYNVTVGEIRAALQGFDIWSSYIVATKPQIANLLNITASLTPDRVISLLGKGQTFSQLDLLSMGAQRTTLLGNRFEEGHPELYNAHLFFSYIYKLADEYYGRKFMVRIPNISVKLEPDTDRLVFSDEPSDGGWMPDGSTPLDLPTLVEDLFQLEDGRFVPFATYPSGYLQTAGITINGLDTSELSPENTLVSNNGLFLDGTLEDFIVFLDSNTLRSPRVILNLNGRVLKNTELAPAVDALVTFLQDSNNTSKAISQTTDTLNIVTDPQTNDITTTVTDAGKELIKQSLRGREVGYIPELLSPYAIMPSAVVVPLRSNVLTYGPWYSLGPAGKVYFEQDNTLVPWNFGSINALNFAGNAKIAQKVTSLQISERGSLTLPGSPTINLGESLQFGMPIVNSIDVTTDVQQGVTTTYKMETFNERFGVFSKANFDRFSRITRNAQQYKRNFLQQQRNAAFLANRNFQVPKKGVPSKQRETKTPHEALVCNINPKTGKIGASFLTLDEGLGSLRSIEPSGFISTSLSTLDSLFCPFTCDSGNLVLPRLRTATSGATKPTVNELNPYVSGTAIQILTNNDVLPSSFFTSDSWFNPNKVRAPAFRAPIFAAGYGYDTDGYPFPNAALSGGKSNSFASGYLNTPTSWFVGPLDLRMDLDRGVWVTTSSPDIAVIIAVSGYFNNDATNFRPRYVVRPITSIASGGALTYTNFTDLPPMSGATDKFVFNLQENIGDKNTLAVGSPVILYNKYGQTFFNELPRSFAHRTNY